MALDPAIPEAGRTTSRPVRLTPLFRPPWTLWGEPLQPNLMPIRVDAARTEVTTFAVLRLAGYAFEDDRLRLEAQHLAGLFVDDLLHQAALTIRAAAVGDHLSMPQHAAVAVLAINGVQNRLKALHANPLSRLQL